MARSIRCSQNHSENVLEPSEFNDEMFDSRMIKDSIETPKSTLSINEPSSDKEPIASKTFNPLIENEKFNQTDTSSSKDETNTQSEIPALLRLNTYKAGLDGLDIDRANRLIKLAGSRKGSRFYEHQEKRQKRIDAQIAELCRKAELLDDQKRKIALQKADIMIREMNGQRILNRVIVHFDMDMFFAACEIKADPSLADKPMAVGSMAMISTSNYVARKFGVRSAMAGFIAKRLCPSLILITPHMSLYKRESEKIMSIIQEYDQNPSSASLDEVYIDLTDYLFKTYSCSNNVPLTDLYQMSELSDDIWNTAADIVSNIRERVFLESKLTVSAGISCNTTVAKICTDMQKPNGQFMIKGRCADVMDFVSGLKLRKFPGVGPVRGQMLAGLGIELAKDIYDKRDLIVSLFSDLNSYDTLKLYLGLGSTNLSSSENYVQKSHSREHTMGDCNKLDVLILILKSLTEQLDRDLKRHSQLGRTITLKMKKDNFEVFLKSRTIPTHTDDNFVIFRVVKELLQQEHSLYPNQFYRLIGIKISSLIEKQINKNDQTTLEKLFDKKRKKDNTDNVLTTNKDEVVDKNSFICRLCECEFENFEQLLKHKSDCNGDYLHITNESDHSGEVSINEFSTHIPIDEGSLSSSSSSFMSSSSSTSSSSSFLSSKNNDVKIPEVIERGEEKSVKEKSVKIFDCSSESMLCPICNMVLVFEDNASLNCHIDTCLNRSICSELTKISPKKIDTSSFMNDVPPSTSSSSSSSFQLTLNRKKGQKRKKSVQEKSVSGNNLNVQSKGINAYFEKLSS